MRLKNFSLNFGVQVFKALSEEPRVRILHIMYHKGDMCISDLEIILSYTQAKTSRHLSYLKNSGIVKAKKVDQWVFYSIKEEVTDLMKVIMDYFIRDITLQQDLGKYEILFSNNELAKCQLIRSNLVD